jgi:RHS repeat-associated protein
MMTCRNQRIFQKRYKHPFASIIAATLLITFFFLQVMAQTKPNLAAGKSAGSFSLSDFDAVNLYNGNLLFNLPLLTVGGRGHTGYSMGLNINSLHWKVESESVGGYGTEHICPSGGCGDRYIVTFTYTSTISTSGSYYCFGCTGSGPGCVFDFSTVPEVESRIVLDGTPLEGGGGLAPEFTYYNVSPSHIQKVNPGYGPGVVRALTDKKWNRTWRGQLLPGSALTRIVFTAPDGSEYQLVDDQTNGQVRLGGTTGAFPYNRGRNFHSIDGSAMTFISDADIIENFGGFNPGPSTLNASGYLLFSDGTRHRVVNGLIVWIRDRNGNQTNFSYYNTPLNPVTHRKVNIVTDSLGRTATVDYALSGGGTSIYDRIKYSVSGEIDRYVKIWKDSLQNSLYGNEQISSYGSLFSQYEQDPTNASTIYNPSDMIKSVELPDGRRYEIRYNSYGEIAALILPTDGKIEYDYMSIFNLLQVERRVKERRIFKSSAGTTPELTETYTAGFQGSVSQQHETHVTIERKQGDTLLSKSKHYFYGGPTAVQLGLYSPWKEGREYKTETIAADGTTVLSSVEMIWKPKGFFSWFNNGAESNHAPADSPRVVETKTTLLDVSPALVSKTTSINPGDPNQIGFDQFNNPTDVWEYDFGQGGPGQLLRHTRTDYLTTNSVNGIDYTTNGVHIRRLSAGTKVYGYKNGQEVLLSRNEVKYDETPLEPRSNVVGWTDPQTPARGLVTTTKTWINTTDASLDQNSPQAYVQTRARYDALGNVVETTDGKGIKFYIHYDDNFGFADDEARQNNPPSQLNGQSTFAFATKAINVLGHTVYKQFNYFTGATVNTEDANGVVSSIAYDDALDRPTQSIQARYKVGSGVPAERRQSTITYDDANRVITTASDRDTFNDNILTAKTYYDGLGRTWRNAAREGATWSITDTQFDALGRVSHVSNPYRATDPGSASPPSGLWTTNEYDAIGRPIKVTTADGAHVDTAYNGNQVTVTDQAGKTRRSETDALGRLIKVMEDPSGLNHETTYLYDALDNLRKVMQGAQTRWFAYDSLSRLVRVKNPEQSVNSSLPPHTDPVTGGGGWAMAYSYDANGNLTQRIDARGVVTNYSYDALNRNTGTSYNINGSQTRSVEMVYDGAVNGKGRLHYERTQEGGVNATETKMVSYDALGRPLNKQQSFWRGSDWGTPFETQQSYDLAGAVKTVTYPSDRTVNYGYDQAGRLNSFTGNLGDGVNRNYATGMQYDAAGLMKREQFGTTIPLYHRRHYNNRGQLFDIRLGTDPNPLYESDDLSAWQNAAGSWNRGALKLYYSTLDGCHVYGNSGTNNNGNPLRMDHHIPLDDAVSNFVASIDKYDYDPLNRLKSATELSYTKGPSGEDIYQGGFRQAFIYDRWGNRTIDQALTTGGVNEKAYTVDTATNRLTSVDGVAMIYDAAGNQTNDGSGQRIYDGENRMVETYNSAGMRVSWYVYDAEGRRVVRTVGSQGTWQVYGCGGELLAEYAVGASPSDAQKEYGYRNGQLLVVWDGSETGDRQLQWLVQDHLGSTRMVADRSGSLGGVRRHDFLPFGEELFAVVGIRSVALGYGADSTHQKFTSKERDYETGLDYFLARYYSSTQGRFTSPDIPFADQSEGDPQSWNLYTYVGNKPLTYTDPFGMWKKVDCSSGNCWEAEKNDTLGTLAEQTGIRRSTLTWFFYWVNITPGETVIDVTGVEDDRRALAEQALQGEGPPLFYIEPGGGGIIRKFGPAAAGSAGRLISRAWSGIRSYFRKPTFNGISAEEIMAINRQVGGTTTLTGYVDSVIANMSYRTSFWDKAATVIRDIAGRHLFNDGNKRTAQMVVEELMRRNGVNGPTSQHIRAVIDKVARGELRSVEEISSALSRAN